MAMLRAIRGATTVDADLADQIHERTQALVAAMLERNKLDVDDLVSLIFTSTPDLHASFPATAARGLGLSEVPLLGATEADVPGALERCIRVMLHCYTDLPRAEIRHVYLEGARSLRTDLAD
jgi:chorismate mutase